MMTTSFIPAGMAIQTFIGSLSSSSSSTSTTLCSSLLSTTATTISSSLSKTTTTIIASAAIDIAATGGDEIDTIMFLLPGNPLLSPFFISIIAIVLLIAAQSFINQMLEGDQGLGAFLRDGSGYNRSGYRDSDRNRSESNSDSNDPLPWLKLPSLDFVEVAGQKKNQKQLQQQLLLGNDEERKVYKELERLRLKLNIELENNQDLSEATRLRVKIERLMKIYGIEYETE